jgi:hypothetical protein
MKTGRFAQHPRIEQELYFKKDFFEREYRL